METKVKLAPYLLIAGALVGIANTLYLSYYHLIGATPTCALLSGCEKVLHSPYAAPLGVPLAYLGLVFYISMLGLAILFAIEPNSKAFSVGVLTYTTIGLLCSLWFESLQIFIIGAICMYCLISALTTLYLFVVAVWHYRCHAGRVMRL